MMIYKVRAKLKTETAADFLKKLTDGTILSQRPDGAEMVNSMNRAVVTVEESVEWSEQCFCSTPLAHERATVLDTYFEGILTEPIDDCRRRGRGRVAVNPTDANEGHSFRRAWRAVERHINTGRSGAGVKPDAPWTRLELRF